MITESTRIEEVADRMLKDSTGSYLTDSGGAYGRHWERNQGRNFAEEPAVTASWSAWRGRLEMCATVSLYHWMVHNLELDADMQASFESYCESRDGSWLLLMEEFSEEFSDEFSPEAEPRVINTYNDPDNCDLSQTIQYVELFAESSYAPSHVILSVHGGCDVRGGYGKPRCFRLTCEDREFLDTMRVDGIYCSSGSWYLGTGGDVEPSSHNLRGSPEDILRDVHAVDFDLYPPPAVEEILSRAEAQKKALDGTNLTAEKVAEYTALIDQASKGLVEKALDEAIDELLEEYSYVVAIRNRKAYLENPYLKSRDRLEPFQSHL